jgi:hypothetical protein
MMDGYLAEISNLLQLPELIAFSVFILFLVGVLVLNLSLANKNRKLRSQVMQLALDKTMLIERLEATYSKSTGVEQTEGFVKFLSESRDWAFEYIEGVQAALKDFEIAMESKSDNAIEKALNNLKNFLPKNEEENKKKENEEKE